MGVPAVYEISNNFRTEEREDETHLFEFDSVEALYADRELSAMFSIMESVCRSVARDVSAINELPSHPISNCPQYATVNLCEWVEAELSMDSLSLLNLDGLADVAQSLDKPLHDDLSLTDAADHVIETIAGLYEEPVFIGCFPPFFWGPS